MADLSDVETALVGLIITTVYPSGTSHPSVIGTTIRAYRGWPQTSALNADLAAQSINVSVFASPGSSRNTTRWNWINHELVEAPTLTVTVADNSVSFSGTGGSGQIVGILVDNKPFTYRSRDGDTPSLIAAVLAQEISAVRTCWLSGPTVNIPNASRLIARCVRDAQTLTEWNRQEHSFRISMWCPNPSSRDRISSALSSSIAAVSFLPLADSTSGRLRYRDTVTFDDGQNAQLYRRDLLYTVEYATTSISVQPRMVFGDLATGNGDRYN